MQNENAFVYSLQHVRHVDVIDDTLAAALRVVLVTFEKFNNFVEMATDPFDLVAYYWVKIVSEQLKWTPAQKSKYTSHVTDFTLDAWRCCTQVHDVSSMNKMCKYLAKKDYTLESLLYPDGTTHSHVDLVKVLIEHSLVKNGEVDNFGTTLAHYAAKFNVSSNGGRNVNASHDWKFVIDYLISNNYRFSKRDAFGKLPIDYICHNDDIELLNYLLNVKKMSIDTKNIQARIQHMNLVNNDDDIVKCLSHFGYSCFQRLLEFAHLFNDKIPQIINHSVAYGLNHNKKYLLETIINCVLCITARGIDVMRYFKLAIAQNLQRTKLETILIFFTTLKTRKNEIIWQLIDEYSWLLTNIDVKDWMRDECKEWIKREEKDSKHTVILVRSAIAESICIACNVNVKECHHCIKCDYSICTKCSQTSTLKNNAQAISVKFDHIECFNVSTQDKTLKN